MTADPTASPAPGLRRHRYLLLAATVMTGLLVTMGGIVCVTESGAACPDWPGCYGRVVPPPQANAIIEYTHRFIAALTSPLIVAAALNGWRKARALRWISRPPALALVFLAAVIVFGALTVLRGLPPGLAALDLGSALIVLALLTTATTMAYARHAQPGLADRLTASSALARLSLWTLCAVFLVHISGILVAGQGSLTRCLGWPAWRLIPNDVSGWPQLARLAISAMAALLVVAVVIQAWRTQRRQRALLRAATLAGLLFLIEMADSLVMSVSGGIVLLLVVHVAAAAGLWAMLVVLVVLAALVPTSVFSPSNTIPHFPAEKARVVTE